MRGPNVTGAEGSLKIWAEQRHGLPGTPVEWQKASSPQISGTKLCPLARYNVSESRPAVTLSFGDAIQLERLTMVTLMAFQTSLKDVEIEEVE